MASFGRTIGCRFSFYVDLFSLPATLIILSSAKIGSNLSNFHCFSWFDFCCKWFLLNSGTILVINVLASSVISTSIKTLILESKQVFPSVIFDSSFHLNNITNASILFWPNVKPVTIKLKKYIVFGQPYWQLPL